MILDFVISNPSHHAAMCLPVVKTLIKNGDVECRVLSLCEFRGLQTPVEVFEQVGASVRKVIQRPFRKPSAGTQTGRRGGRIARRLARQISWSLLLRPSLEAALQQRPRLVVLPNDAAFPYDRLCRVLHELAIPYMLMQEGIRFPLPGSDERYGTSGCAAIAAWGENSVQYFRSQGVPEMLIHATGNPRFDALLNGRQQAESADLDQQFNLTKKCLLLVTNPIDDLGFCTSQAKINLVRSFIEGLAPLFNEPDFTLVVKLHGRESYSAYRDMIAETRFSDSVRLIQDFPLQSLMKRCCAVAVLASTVGLEALLHGCTLGVLEIPGSGFVFDYVDSGAALGLRLNADLPENVRRLMDPDAGLIQRGTAYAARNLVAQGHSTPHVVTLIRSLVGLGKTQSSTCGSPVDGRELSLGSH